MPRVIVIVSRSRCAEMTEEARREDQQGGKRRRRERKSEGEGTRGRDDSSKPVSYNSAKCLAYKDKYNGRRDEVATRSRAPGGDG